MKVRFIKEHNDGTRTFKCGWVAEVGPSDGQKLIQAGVAVEELNTVYSRKYAPSVQPSTSCVVPDAPAEVQEKKAVKPPDYHYKNLLKE